MSDNATALSVSLVELPAVHVACLTYQPSAETGDMHGEISTCFRRVQAWVQELGHDPFALLNIGAIHMANGRLAAYDCCVQVPEYATTMQYCAPIR